MSRKATVSELFRDDFVTIDGCRSLDTRLFASSQRSLVLERSSVQSNQEDVERR